MLSAVCHAVHEVLLQIAACLNKDACCWHVYFPSFSMQPEEALKSMDEVLRLQPDNENALSEIVDIRRQVQQRVQNPVPLRAQTVQPG
jgi:hypothetical protein